MRPPSFAVLAVTNIVHPVGESLVFAEIDRRRIGAVRNPVYDTARAHLAERGIATGRYFAPILFCSLLGGWAQRFLNSN